MFFTRILPLILRRKCPHFPKNNGKCQCCLKCTLSLFAQKWNRQKTRCWLIQKQFIVFYKACAIEKSLDVQYKMIKTNTINYNNLQFIIIILNVYLFLYISSTEKWRGNHLNHQSMKYFKSVHNSNLIKYNILNLGFIRHHLWGETAFIFLFSLCFCSSILCISVFTSIIHCHSRTFWHRLMLNKPQMVSYLYEMTHERNHVSDERVLTMIFQWS